MTMELTRENLLQGLASEIRSPSGPGNFTKAFNEALIAQFRASGGQLTGDFAAAEFLLLTTTGAKSGRRRTTPLAYVALDGRILIIASRGGAPQSPAWYFNLIANPEVTVELGEETYQAKAVELKGADRDDSYAEIARRLPTFAEYQSRTDRIIPVVELRRL